MNDEPLPLAHGPAHRPGDTGGDGMNWLDIARVLKWERERLIRNRGLFPQVSEEYDESIAALRNVISGCEFNAKNNVPFPEVEHDPRT